MVAKSGKREKEMLVVTRLGSRGSGSSGKRFVGGCPIRKSSRSDGKKDVGSCLNGKSTICSTAWGYFGGHEKMKSGDLGLKAGSM